LTDSERRPNPVPDDQSAGYWAAAADHVLALARCMQCGRLAHPPGVVCAACLHPNPGFEFSPVDGAGAIRSWTVIRDSFLPGFNDLVPLVLVDVELDVQTGLRLIGRLVDGVDAELHLGDRVTTVFDDLAPGIAVPAFALVGTS
jgi:uncharacterized OB-fold protein